MRRVLGGLGVFTASLLVLGLAPPGSSGMAAAPPGPSGVVARFGSSSHAALPPRVVTPDSPIEHVVMIYQENHTFDDVLGRLCQVRETPCDGYTGPVTFADGITAPNIVQPDNIPIVDHNPDSQRLGLRNRWDKIVGCDEPPYNCVSHVDPANMVNLTSLANTFTVSDATFAAGKGSSFAAHVTLGGGTFNGFAGYNPVQSVKGVKPREGWGCYSRRDALWGPPEDLSYQPTCIPDRQGNGAYRRTRVPYAPTIMQRVEQAGLSWHIYEGDSETEPTLGSWSVCSYFAWCWRKRWDLEHQSSRAAFVETANEGALPNLSILIPTGSVSQHNGTSMRGGDNYLGEMVGAVMGGPDWDRTAIFITYDDCGCFYDHVDPPSGLGLRNPMVIISPWAKSGGVDSTVAVQPYSMLAFTQHVFGLRSLTSEVDDAYDYADAFDFSQQPLRGPAMAPSRIPLAERRQLARQLPAVERDPT